MKRWIGGLAAGCALAVAALCLVAVLRPAGGGKVSRAGEAYVGNVAAVIAPANMTNRAGARGANGQVQIYVAMLAGARAEGLDVTNVARQAVGLAGYRGEVAAVTLDRVLLNFRRADGMGCLGPEGLAEMEQGKAPTITKGPATNDQLSVDHVVPLKLAPELDKVVANLELLPGRTNSAKGKRVWDRQLGDARKMHRAGLLGDASLRRVEEAAAATEAAAKKGGGK